MIENIQNLQGIIVPTIVPFVERNSKLYVDSEGQQNLLASLARAKVDCVFLGSNAGESRHMDFDSLIYSIHNSFGFLFHDFPHLKVVTGVLRKDINEAVKLATFAQDRGTDAIVVAPGYSDISAENTIKEILNHTSAPLIIYNNPDFQDKTNLPLDLIKNISRNLRIVGIKDSSRDPVYFNELLKLRSETFQVFQGDTKAGLQPDVTNCDGMVAIEANVYPEALVARWQRNQIGSLQGVLDNFNENKKTYGGSVGYCKEILYRRGVIHSPVLYK